MKKIFGVFALLGLSLSAHATTRTAIMKQEEAITEHGVQQRASDPGSPTNGQQWINTTSGILKYRSGGVTSALSGGGVTATPITVDTTLAAGNRYLVNKSPTEAALTLPASCSVGDQIDIVGVGAGGWRLKSNAAAAAQTVKIGAMISQTSSSSAIRLVSAASISDALSLICTTANSIWTALSNIGSTVDLITATGGTITTDGDYKVHTFTSSGTFQITNGMGTVESLVIAGGGAGGSDSAGGGGGAGAGGVVYTTPGSVYGVGSYTVTVGAGGTNVPSGTGNNGANSDFDAITATGGAGGGSNAVGSNGGSGGGGGARAAGSFAGGTGVAGQGFAGGSGFTDTFGPAGGGGGAGGTGFNGAAGVAGNGGLGVANSITGSSVTYASGGGGGVSAGTVGTASAGGGSNGSTGGASNATANTGGGGGGAAGNGGNGGSGIVIVRYKFQ